MNYEKWSEAKSVCVIGAGTMGSGIAAHLANIGFEVTLLDLSFDSVRSAFDRAKAQKPPHFFVPETADKIRLGSINENIAWAAEADWVCEAVVEKLDIKRSLFEMLDAIVPEDSMISTNTSGLEISLLAEGRSESFQKRFVGTHFFNPPRYLKLLELIPTDFTDPNAVRAIASFLENKCARRVVVAKDTPGFIANRFGMWSMFHAIHSAEKLGLPIEVVDAICGPFLGRPRSGAFRLNDLVGLDIMQDIARNLIERCVHDPHTADLSTPKSMEILMAGGHLGSKTGSGYYKKEGKELLAYDFQTEAYRQLQTPNIPSLNEFGKLPLAERIKNTLESRDEAGEFLRVHLIPVLQYANYLKEEISHSVLDFDRVMQWGFGWEVGPFQLIDMIGAEKLGISDGPFYMSEAQRNFSGDFVSLPSEPEYASVGDFEIIESKDGFNVRALGDGILALSITTKAGVITPALVKSLTAYLTDNSKQRFVLTSEAKHFSVGFDLNFFLNQIQAEDFESIEQALVELQDLSVLLSRCHIVAAVHGFCLGAGTELAIACPTVVAHADAQIGLPESKVGLLPGGAGTARLALRSQLGGAKHVVDVCSAVGQGFVSSCADDARRFDLLRVSDLTCYHPDRLLYEARKAALSVEVHPLNSWAIPAGPIGGMVDQAQKELKAKGDFSDHDELIADKIKHVFTKPTSFEDALAWERSGFADLCRSGLSVARIRHMVETNKPLRN